MPSTVAAPLRPRYAVGWRENFDAFVRAAVPDATSILDIGGGRSPAIPVEQRPRPCRYVGLDLSAAELAAAPADAYDEMIVSDVSNFVPTLEARFDLVVSFQVFEHVRSLPDAISNIRRYLRPGGQFIAQLSGKWAFFAIMNRALPHSLAVFALTRLLGRDPRSVFPAPYDHCVHSELQRCFAEWARLEIVCRFGGAGYLRFAPPVRAVYLHYEDWIERHRRLDLATHYTLRAWR